MPKHMQQITTPNGTEWVTIEPFFRITDPDIVKMVEDDPDHRPRITQAVNELGETSEHVVWLEHQDEVLIPVFDHAGRPRGRILEQQGVHRIRTTLLADWHGAPPLRKDQP